MNNYIPWFILLLPLISALLILLFTKRCGNLSATISVSAVGLSFLGSVIAFFTADFPEVNEFQWITIGTDFHISIGLTVDALSKVMLLVVTGVGLLVHLYSTIYMEKDDGKARFFGGLSLFIFSMLGIVLANNFAMMFIFWELVGVSSYLLIGHWFQRDAAAAAANKAFITNRIGDFGFMIGILMVWIATHSLNFVEISNRMSGLQNMPAYLTVAALCIFCGAVGKSAQFPLHVWLPDAMEGPTPVSALIHAATMVAAGVYMLTRVFFLIGASADALNVIAIIGAITMVLAALMATRQDDIKRILAYSTLSQLGYMVMAVGLNSPQAAMFHLFTHAFFKALLFLGAGAVIHALHHEQDIWKMGGLRKTMPKTFLCFAIGTLALMGFPYLFSGFYSKDAILLEAYHHNPYLFVAGLIGAFLTSYYMTRLVVVAFLGKPRTHEAEHGHDGPFLMTMPLQVLAVLSIIAGFAPVASFVFGDAFMEKLEGAQHVAVVPLLASSVFVLGAIIGWVIYGRAEKEPLDLAILRPVRDKFYFDEFYGALIAGTQDLLAKISAWLDKWVIDGLIVRGSAAGVWGIGFILRFLQVGNLQGYAFLFGAGVVALIFFVVFTK